MMEFREYSARTVIGNKKHTGDREGVGTFFVSAHNDGIPKSTTILEFTESISKLTAPVIALQKPDSSCLGAL